MKKTYEGMMLITILGRIMKEVNDMISDDSVEMYCSEDPSHIENYMEAINDDSQTWCLHHKGEILPCGRFTRLNLIKYGLYYFRPASELIFLPRKEHMRIHQKGVKKVFSVKGDKNPMYGKHHTEETKNKISECRIERIKSGDITVDTSMCHTKEANNIISMKAKDRLKDKVNHPMYGKHHSEETRKKISESNKGKIPWNKGRRK